MKLGRQHQRATVPAPSSACAPWEHPIWGEGCVPNDNISQIPTDPSATADSLEDPTDEYAKDDNCDEEDYLGGCDFASTQTCVVANYYAKDGQTALIEMFIEDEISVDVADIKSKCPKYLKAWQTAQRGFNDGSYEVGKEIKPGT
jgi:hypothetical protein